jgi:hypothetical protein
MQTSGESHQNTTLVGWVGQQSIDLPEQWTFSHALKRQRSHAKAPQGTSHFLFGKGQHRGANRSMKQTP